MPKRLTMLYRLLPFVFVAATLGCQSKPFPVWVRGDIGGDLNGSVGVNGNVGIAGDLGIDGALDINGDLSTSIKADNTASRLSTVFVEGNTNAPGSVAVIDVDGLLVNQAAGGLGENPVALFREKLVALRSNPDIRAVVLRIDSPGGGVTATDMMAHELSIFRQETGIPVVSCLMTHGAGGAFYIATGADSVVAHPTSIVGGIGVILNLYNMEDALGQYNITAIPVKTGTRIDAGSPVRTMEEDERNALQSLADSFQDRFVQRVKQTRLRLLPPGDGDSTDDWFDGRVVDGETAVAAGLIDQVGYLDDAITIATQLANLPPDCNVVMLRRDNDRAYTTLDITPNTSQLGSLLPLNIPGLDRSKLPTFMYLWQIEPSFASRR